MKIEVLLKQIRQEKRNKFATAFKNDRNINITFKLYRKKRKRTVTIDDCKDSTSIEYWSWRIVWDNTIAQILC